MAGDKTLLDLPEEVTTLVDDLIHLSRGTGTARDKKIQLSNLLGTYTGALTAATLNLTGTMTAAEVVSQSSVTNYMYVKSLSATGTVGIQYYLNGVAKRIHQYRGDLGTFQFRTSAGVVQLALEDDGSSSFAKKLTVNDELDVKGGSANIDYRANIGLDHLVPDPLRMSGNGANTCYMNLRSNTDAVIGQMGFFGSNIFEFANALGGFKFGGDVALTVGKVISPQAAVTGWTAQAYTTIDYLTVRRMPDNTLQLDGWIEATSGLPAGGGVLATKSGNPLGLKEESSFDQTASFSIASYTDGKCYRATIRYQSSNNTTYITVHDDGVSGARDFRLSDSIPARFA